MAWKPESRSSCNGGCSVVIEHDSENNIHRATLDVYNDGKLCEVGLNSQDAKKRLAERLETIVHSLRGGR